MRITLRELARFGELIRLGGRWEGREIVPTSWISELVAPVNPAPRKGGYGFLWWLPAPGCVATNGYLDNSVYVLPDRDAIFARWQRMRHLHQVTDFDEDRALKLLRAAVPGRRG